MVGYHDASLDNSVLVQRDFQANPNSQQPAAHAAVQLFTPLQKVYFWSGLGHDCWRRSFFADRISAR